MEKEKGIEERKDQGKEGKKEKTGSGATKEGDATGAGKRFFKVFFPEQSGEGFLIPLPFHKYLEEEPNRLISLKGPNGNTWKVFLTSDSKGLAFTQGWREFVSDHSLEPGHILVFTYDGCSEFSVVVLCRLGIDDESALDAQPSKEIVVKAEVGVVDTKAAGTSKKEFPALPSLEGSGKIKKSFIQVNDVMVNGSALKRHISVQKKQEKRKPKAIGSTSKAVRTFVINSKKLGSNIWGSNESDDAFEPESLATNIYEYPDPDFHNFEEGLSNENFECGQIWALYSHADKFPKLYGRIDKVESKPFRVHLNWLDTWTQSEQEKLSDEMKMPMSCGMFKVRKCTTMFDTTQVFSHLVDAKETSNELQFEIFPRVGEIWVIYKNWAPDRVPSSASEFAVGEIIEVTEACTKFCFLSKVDGYTSVFQPDMGKSLLEIPINESLRFSHRIPSFCLTKEGGAKLNGLYELDTASVPEAFMCRGTP